MSEHYQNMMNQIKLSDEAKKDFKAKLFLKSDVVSCKSYSLRKALIAACICIMFVVGAILAVGANEDVTADVSEITSSVSDSSFNICAVMKLRCNDFSSALQADIKAGNIEKAFYSKDELEKYLGFNLIDSPELETAKLNKNLKNDIELGLHVPSELAIDPSARYVVTDTVLSESSSSDIEKQAVKVTCHRIVMNSEVYIDARFLSEDSESEYSEVFFCAESFEPVLLPSHELIVNPDDPSDFRVITTNYVSAQKDFTTASYTMANGCTATIVTIADIEMDGTKGFHQYRGYFIKNGILYSINPYAIYNPAKRFPMHDSDMLTVLKHVLDSFE